LEQIDHHMIELDDGSKPMDRVQVCASQSAARATADRRSL